MMKKTKCSYCNKREAMTVEIPMEEFDKLEKLAFSAHIDELLVEKLKEQLYTAENYIEHAIGTIKHDGHLGTIQTDWILPDLEKALAAIGGDNE
ncbi:hypothetical protein [Lactococcus lactis]|uniref:hypothetical protein n=1 Tax=Lactococcus lactis TaxID=1358 RepID=UPI00223A9598|nr:hypothetical protein [Lactococcus lactis]